MEVEKFCVNCKNSPAHCACPGPNVPLTGLSGLPLTWRTMSLRQKSLTVVGYIFPSPPPTWRTMSRRQKALTVIGYIFAFIIAVGCGVTPAAAFITLNLMTAGLPCYLVAGLFFLAGFAMNWYINKNAVPTVLVKIFGKGRPFEHLMKMPNGAPFCWKRKTAMWLGVLLSLSVGFTNGVLAYAGVFTLTSAFGFLAAISSAFPPIAAILAGVTMVCLTAVMLDAIIHLAHTENLKGKCKDFFEQLFSISEKFPHNKGKSKGRRIVERSVTVLLTLGVLPLAALGLYMTMNASAASAKIFLLKNIPKASEIGVEIATKFISLVLAFSGRIPFTVRNIFKTLVTVRNIFKTLARICTKEKGPEPQVVSPHPQVQSSTAAQVLHVLKCVALSSLCVANAVGNSLISVVGGGGVPSGVGGGINSLAAGASNIHPLACNSNGFFNGKDGAQAALLTTKEEESHMYSLLAPEDLAPEDLGGTTSPSNLGMDAR